MKKWLLEVRVVVRAVKRWVPSWRMTISSLGGGSLAGEGGEVVDLEADMLDGLMRGEWRGRGGWGCEVICGLGWVCGGQREPRTLGSYMV